VTFHEGGDFEGGRVQSRGPGRGIAIGGGVTGLVVVVLVTLLNGGNLGDVLNAVGGGSQSGGTSQGTTIQRCSAEQANTQRDCRLSATVQGLDAYWQEALAAQGTPFSQPPVVSFTSQTSTGCGAASSSTGPFYCPTDRTVYLDLGFYDQLQSQFGAQDGPLAEMYVTAHEYGHHVQNLLGTMSKIDHQGTGATSDSVKLELQADCYAGIWIGHAATTKDPQTGVVFLDPVTPQQLSNALAAAQAVGDDHIQQQSGGGVNPDTWTHGSSAQREKWFTTGYQKGTLAACDTFSAPSL